MAAEAYWRRLLQDFAAPTPLLASLPPVAAGASTGAGHRERRLPTDLGTALEQMARQHRLTLNTVFQGAWALLLARICDVDEVVFGATVSGRPPELRGVEGMVGLFINTLPVRVDIREGEALVPWLARLQDAQRDQDAHGHSPLAEVQRCSAVPGGTPLFETLLVFENFP
ncbi:condensation domain-containing protein [Pseudoroseomonas wenyumeiae]